MRYRIAARGQRDLHLLPRDQRTSGGGAEEIVTLVDRSRFQYRKEIIARELFLRIDQIEIAGAGAIGLVGQPGSLLLLSDVDGNGNDFAAVRLLQIRNDDRSIEPAGIGQRDFLRLHAAFSFALASTCSSAAMNSRNAFFGVT